eukprot:TRINITY_DN30183_c0_g3_i1.p1 TRINITY_DN30183_c0_g3~~TRINITY_DN30183_c0_g3_i1.p1  ORF type:complete len:773 (+),score=151.99 TRINITY_DN30183_c0_g3_i1:328-2646(+)
MPWIVQNVVGIINSSIGCMRCWGSEGRNFITEDFFSFRMLGPLVRPRGVLQQCPRSLYRLLCTLSRSYVPRGSLLSSTRRAVRCHPLFPRHSHVVSRGTYTDTYTKKMAPPLPEFLRFDFHVAEIASETQRIIRERKDVEDRVVAIPDSERTFDNTVKALADEEGGFGTMYSYLTFLSYVSTSKDVRDASTEANRLLDQFVIDSSMRVDLYKAVQSYASKGEKLEGEDERLLTWMMRDFRRNGLALNPEQQQQLKEVKKRVSDLQISFQQNLNEDTTTLTFTTEELEGMPDDFIEALGKSETHENARIVTLKYPHLYPILMFAKHEETRRRMEFANSSKCMKENIPILEEVLKHRYAMAKMLGYDSWADFTLEIRMAKSPQTVNKFLEETCVKLNVRAQNELDVLRACKKKDKEAIGETSDGIIHAWDYLFYQELFKKQRYELNEEEVKVYLPMERVVEGTLKVYETLFGMRFEELSSERIWHPDVKLFAVYNEGTEDLIGHFFLDLFPRDGKFTHAAAFPLQDGFVRKDGTKQLPTCAMVANFTQPTADKPSLLKHGEMVTFFHEFGHVTHSLMATTKCPRFAGMSVERDFVEVPSQMLENWCYEEEVLNHITHHFETGASMPQELIDKIIRARQANKGLFYRRQIFFGTFDQEVHASGNVDCEEVWTRLRREVSLVPNTEGTNAAATFGHLLGGYDASYYGYMWSEVFSADMFTCFKKEGIMNKEIGSRYRRQILSPGGSRDGEEMLREFLGRDPKPDAFLESMGGDEVP